MRPAQGQGPHPAGADAPPGRRRHCRCPRASNDKARGRRASGADAAPSLWPWATRPLSGCAGRRGPGLTARVSRPPPRSLQLCRTPGLDASSSEGSRSRDARSGAPRAAAPTARPLVRGASPDPASAGPRSPPAPPGGPPSQANAGRAGSPRAPGHRAEGLVRPPEAQDREGPSRAGVNSHPQPSCHPHPKPTTSPSRTRARSVLLGGRECK